jgi:signal peptidase I
VTTPTDDMSPAAPGGPPDRAAAPRKARWLRELVIVVVVAVGLAVLLRTFVVQTFSIPSGSMEPTLNIGDRIVVDKLSYDLHGVGRGDIVVFARPPAEDCAGASGTAYNLQHPYNIPANHYFMMGDNRGDSCDSRFWGPIPKSLMVGKVDIRIWPLTRFHFF